MARSNADPTTRSHAQTAVQACTHLPQQLQVPALDLVHLDNAGAPGEVAHRHELGTAGHPFAVEHRVVEAFLNVDNDLRLLEGGHGAGAGKTLT